MDDLYTRSGLLLQLVGDRLHSRSGRYLGRVVDKKVFDPGGLYCGTLVGDRVVYRTVDSAAKSTPSEGEAVPASTRANARGMPLWGVEPPFAL